MSGKANIKRRKRTTQGRKRAAPQQELKRRRKAAEEKESAEFIETLESRSIIAEQGSTMFVPNEGLDLLFENREP